MTAPINNDAPAATAIAPAHGTREETRMPDHPSEDAPCWSIYFQRWDRDKLALVRERDPGDEPSLLATVELIVADYADHLQGGRDFQNALEKACIVANFRAELTTLVERLSGDPLCDAYLRSVISDDEGHRVVLYRVVCEGASR